MPRGTAAVVRFSSLGDVLLAAQVPSFLRAADPGRHVVFVTKERYAAALRGHPDIDRFYMLEDGSSDPAEPAPLGMKAGLGDLLAALKRESVAEVFDLHQNWRSTRILNALDGARRSIAPKYALRRRLWVYARWLRPEPVPPILSTYRAVAGVGPDHPAKPWLRQSLTDGERTRVRTHAPEDGRGFVFLGVGARWETKRWPARHFVALADAVRGELGLGVRFALAPGEAALLEEFRALLPPDRHGELVSVGFREAAALASLAVAIVSNDSALLHLGPALGVPALGLFGSTVPQFGFAPEDPRLVLEIPLACRPCDVHGKRRCPLGHHACLERLAPERALAALRSVLERRSAA